MSDHQSLPLIAHQTSCRQNAVSTQNIVDPGWCRASCQAFPPRKIPLTSAADAQAHRSKIASRKTVVRQKTDRQTRPRRRLAARCSGGLHKRNGNRRCGFAPRTIPAMGFLATPRDSKQRQGDADFLAIPRKTIRRNWDCSHIGRCPGRMIFPHRTGVENGGTPMGRVSGE